MKAKLRVDKDNYIEWLMVDDDGEYLLPDDFDFSHLYCYRLIDGELIKDQEKADEQDAEYNKSIELADLISQLESSNDDMFGFLEDLGSLNNPLTFISDLISLAKKYATMIANRKSIREQIEELKK